MHIKTAAWCLRRKFGFGGIKQTVIGKRNEEKVVLCLININEQLLRIERMFIILENLQFQLYIAIYKFFFAKLPKYGWKINSFNVLDDLIDVEKIQV